VKVFMKNYQMDLSISGQFFSFNNIIEVDKESEIELHKEVYKIAKYFKEELNYDRIPYSEYGNLLKKYKVLLFTEEALDKYKSEPIPYRIYGACLFSEIKFKKDKDYWVLEWIWFHPFFRNRGYLKKNWSILEEKFSDFFIKKPISNDMKAFLENITSKYKHFEL